MANIFKAKTLVSRTGIFSHEAIAPNLVYNTGYQNIDGLKDFTTKPTVNTIPVLLSGEVSTTLSGVLYSAQINIKNNNGSTIYKGQPVYVSSAAGTNILVKLASNSGEQTSSKTLGLVYQTSLAQNAQGTIVTEGLLQGFNTNAGEEGDPIWLGPTGSLIFGLANKPYAPNHLVYLGVLTRKHANQGEVFVKIQNGFELEELHNVNINHTNALADKNIIRYDSLSGIWFNDTIDSVLPNSIVYNTGNQTISGVKTFAENTTFGDTAQGDFLVISGNQFTVYGSGNFTSGLFVNGSAVLTGVDLSSYATVANLASTGSTLDTNLASTGSTLSMNLALTGSTLNTKINNLSGYINSSASNIVFTTGNQTISGNKTFKNNVIIEQTGIFNAIDLSDTDNILLSGIDIQIVSGSMTLTNPPTISGNPFITGNLSLYATTINLATTGSTLDTKINNLSGYINSTSSNIVFTTGNQSVAGNKTFTGGTTFSGQQVNLIDTALNLSGVGDMTFEGTNINFINSPVFISGTNLRVSGDVIANNLVYNIGNQTISGVKTFATGVNISGNSNIRGTLDVTGLVVSGLGTPFILKSASNSDSVYFLPTINGNAGSLYSNYIYSSNMGSRGDDNLSLSYGGGGARSLIFTKSSINRAILDSDGNFGIGSGISSVPSRFYVSGNSILQGDLTVSGNTTITGHLSAASKSFLIDHPTQVGKKLQYGSLESPYHGIRLTDKNKISAEVVKVYLPEYISALVNNDKVNIQLTNINHDKNLFVKEVNVNENNFTVGMNRGWFDKNEYEFYWSFTAERKDIPKLTVEF